MREPLRAVATDLVAARLASWMGEGADSVSEVSFFSPFTARAFRRRSCQAFRFGSTARRRPVVDTFFNTALRRSRSSRTEESGFEASSRIFARFARLPNPAMDEFCSLGGYPQRISLMERTLEPKRNGVTGLTIKACRAVLSFPLCS